MKSRKLLLTSLCLAALGTVFAFAPAICQTAGLIPTGNCSLPPGQYMLTNMRSGLAVYMEIDASGRMLAQDPKALNFSVTPAGTGFGSTLQNTGGIGGTIGGALNNLTGAGNGTTTPNTQNPNGGFFGGMMKQGLQQIINNKVYPQQGTGAPLQ